MPPLHEIADVNQLTRGKEDLLKKYKKFLCSYLYDIKGTGTGYKQVSELKISYHLDL